MAKAFGVLPATNSENKKVPKREATVLYYYNKKHYLFLHLWMETTGEQLGMCAGPETGKPCVQATSSLHRRMGGQKLKATQKHLGTNPSEQSAEVGWGGGLLWEKQLSRVTE